MFPLRDKFFKKLRGRTPITYLFEEKWGCKNANFMVKEGYSHMLFNAQVPPKSSIWNKISKSKAIPKVDFFYWLLAHKNFLTTDNLQKRGHIGPSRCPLHENFEESIRHLFHHCQVAKEVRLVAPSPLFLRLKWL